MQMMCLAGMHSKSGDDANLVFELDAWLIRGDANYVFGRCALQIRCDVIHVFDSDDF